ncbi:MAG: hypothetical protein LCH38_10965 [Proteobacteria bacterium]|nr:hypothetical protein [Pseudomonadota bacterium]
MTTETLRTLFSEPHRPPPPRTPEEAWACLTPEERDEAMLRAPEFIAVFRDLRRELPPLMSYLVHKRWLSLRPGAGT